MHLQEIQWMRILVGLQYIIRGWCIEYELKMSLLQDKVHDELETMAVN